MRLRAALMALCVLAIAAMTLGHGPQAQGQEHNATAAARDGTHDDGLAARVDALERAAAREGQESILISALLPSLLAIIAGAQSAYLTVHLDKRRRRPTLAWTTYGDGNRLDKKNMPDGSVTLMVRITNVGEAAAVDIESRTTTSVQEPSGQAGQAASADPTIDFVGSLHPKASADIPITLSSGELERIRDGEVATLDIVLDYKGADSRAYSCGIAVIYSGRFEVLVTRWRD